MPLRYPFSELGPPVNREKPGEALQRLIRVLQEKGSLRAAAMEMGMAYSKAFGILRSAEERLGLPLTQRKIGGVGHETSDTEAPITSGKSNYEVEYYILSQNKMHLELLTNVDRCPPVGGLVFCTFPAVVGGTGFPARCFALCPKES